MGPGGVTQSLLRAALTIIKNALYRSPFQKAPEQMKTDTFLHPSTALSTQLAVVMESPLLGLAWRLNGRVHLQCGWPGLDPWSGKSPGGGHGGPLQYSCLENPTGREAWQATVRGIAKSQT